MLNFSVHTNEAGWVLTIVHRTENGGIKPMISEHAKLVGVLAHIKSVVETCGVER